MDSVYIRFLFPLCVMYKGIRGVSNTSCSQKAADKQTDAGALLPAPGTADVGLTRQVPRDRSSPYHPSSPSEPPSPCRFPTEYQTAAPGRFRYMSSCFSAPLERMCNDICMHCLEGTDNHTTYEGKLGVST